MRGVEKDARVASQPVASPAKPPSTSGEAAGVLNLMWAETFALALARSGVTDAVIAPGSRSAPLAVALHRSPIRTHVALDERSGAFFALGLARASRRPAAILCTSGTAAANFHPAILEARHARVPLVALTADRPPELRDTGAPQTVDQIKLYGDAVLWFCEVGAPEAGADLERYVASLAARAAATAWGPPAGPVHLNFAFREPLLPSPGVRVQVRAAEEITTNGDHAGGEPSPAAIERCASMVIKRRRGIILYGPDDAERHVSEAIVALADALGYPIFADPLSGLRYGAHGARASDDGAAATDTHESIVDGYDLFLRAPAFVEGHAPELFLHFGAAPTSKALARYASMFPDAVHDGVDAAGSFRDPSRRTHVIRADPARFARALSSAVGGAVRTDAAWVGRFRTAGRSAANAVAAALGREGNEITEPALYGRLLESAPEGTLLYVGNSMPVRDLDTFTGRSAKSVRALGNRGVSGIDGVLSSALGASAASGSPVLAVLGDLSFHHDLNGLAAIREGRARAVIVVVNNDGGGIFSMLPVAEHGDVFERYFVTPHGLTFEHAAALYGLPYARPKSLSELATRAGDALRAGRSEILEVRCDREAGAAQRKTLLAEAVRAVEALS